MKTLKLFIVLLFAVFFSCSKHDDPQPTLQEKIMGKWYMQSYDGETDDCIVQSYVDFISNSEMVSESHLYAHVGDTDCTVYGPDTLHYTLNSNDVIIINEDEGEPWKILSVTNTQLKISVGGATSFLVTYIKAN